VIRTVLRRIRRSELNELAREWHFSLDESELDEYERLAESIMSALDETDRRPQPPVATLAAQRQVLRRASPDEDPYNAIVHWCRVRADGAGGLLDGVRIAVKDSVAVAGLPMTCGSRLLSTFVPDRDSTVVRRLLEAGGEIVATTNMDDMAFSGGGDSSHYGPTLCPFDTSRTAGGSSSGSGASLWYEGIDAAIGCDQGGSIRVPAAWCGVVGLKPTHGLVPYTAIAGIDATFDHCGPMARTVGGATRLLQAIAGKDPADPRQGAVPERDFLRAVAEAGDGLGGVRIGVVREGFETDVDPEVADAVRGAAERLRELGAELREVSVPEHLRAAPIAFPGFHEGMTALDTSGGNGYHRGGEYWPQFAIALHEGLAAHADELSPQMKATLIVGTHLRRHYAGAVYARAQNLRVGLRASHDAALADVDCLLMPTTPGKPHPWDPELPIDEFVLRGWGVLANTAPTDMTGHPALTIPAAESAALPVGVMLIGRHFDDHRLLAIARVYEQRFGWTPQHPGDPRAPEHRVP
jgi:amidase